MVVVAIVVASIAEVELSVIVPVVVIATVAILVGVMAYCVTKMIRDRNLANIAWKLDYTEIDFKSSAGRTAFGSQVDRSL